MCRCAEVQVQRRCKVGAEVVQRWCRGAGPEVVQRWCKGDAEGGAEKVQRQRSRGSKVLRFWGAECTRCWGAVEVQRCRGSADVLVQGASCAEVQRGRGAEMLIGEVQRCWSSSAERWLVIVNEWNGEWWSSLITRVLEYCAPSLFALHVEVRVRFLLGIITTGFPPQRDNMLHLSVCRWLCRCRAGAKKEVPSMCGGAVMEVLGWRDGDAEVLSSRCWVLPHLGVSKGGTKEAPAWSTMVPFLLFSHWLQIMEYQSSNRQVHVSLYEANHAIDFNSSKANCTTIMRKPMT
jgi:hypothetical protein